MQDFAGKAILVTGSTRGIGRAIAESLAAAGAVVGIHGRQLEKAAAVCREMAGRQAGHSPAPVAVAGDFSDPGQGAAVVRAFAEAAGRLDGLVNNAGGGKAVAFRGMSLEKWRQTFAVDLDAAMCASREAYALMRGQNRCGNIVNVASIAAHGPGKWMGADYAAAKAGLVSLTKSLAFEAARFGIRVNAVSPGMVETDMTSVLTEQQKQNLGIPMGRLASPREAAGAVMFLLSEESAYITGEVLHVDGGLWM
jgi:3-oxoacyl-[acyl-carrier protein] reductase